jgi:hypothetical protein
MGACLILMVGCLAMGRAQSVTLAWDPNPENDIAGYLLYYGNDFEYFIFVVDVGNITSATVSNLIEGITYYFAVTAYNMAGLESDFSNEVSCLISGPEPTRVPDSVSGRDSTTQPAVSPSVTIKPISIATTLDHGVRIMYLGEPGRSYVIEAASTLMNVTWEKIGMVTAGADGIAEFQDLNAPEHTNRFYRASGPASSRLTE